MHPFGRHFLVLRQVEQLAQGVFRTLGLCANDAKAVAAPPDLHIQARFQQPQIFIQRTTQVREPRIVSRLEIEFAM